MKMDDLGVPLFSETSIFSGSFLSEEGGYCEGTAFRSNIAYTGGSEDEV